MGTVSQIHADLIAIYERNYQRTREYSLEAYRDSGYAELRRTSEELTKQHPGFLSIRHRAQREAERDAIDELMEKIILGTEMK